MGYCARCGFRSDHNKLHKEFCISLHTFPNEKRRHPTNLDALRAIWVQFVGKPGYEPLKKSSLCSLHFEEQYFDRSSRLMVRLRENAVPTLDLPGIKFNGLCPKILAFIRAAKAKIKIPAYCAVIPTEEQRSEEISIEERVMKDLGVEKVPEIIEKESTVVKIKEEPEDILPDDMEGTKVDLPPSKQPGDVLVKRMLQPAFQHLKPDGKLQMIDADHIVAVKEEPSPSVIDDPWENQGNEQQLTSTQRQAFQHLKPGTKLQMHADHIVAVKEEPPATSDIDDPWESQGNEQQLTSIQLHPSISEALDSTQLHPSISKALDSKYFPSSAMRIKDMTTLTSTDTPKEVQLKRRIISLDDKLKYLSGSIRNLRQIIRRQDKKISEQKEELEKQKVEIQNYRVRETRQRDERVAEKRDKIRLRRELTETRHRDERVAEKREKIRLRREQIEQRKIDDTKEVAYFQGQQKIKSPMKIITNHRKNLKREIANLKRERLKQMNERIQRRREDIAAQRKEDINRQKKESTLQFKEILDHSYTQLIKELHNQQD